MPSTEDAPFPAPSGDLKDLLKRAGEGCSAAASQIVERYQEPLLVVIRGSLQRRVRNLLDSTDVLQEVWTDFFTEVLRNGLSTPECVIAYLQGVARFKTLEANRQYLYRQKNDLRKQRPLDDADASADRGMVCREPTPPQSAGRREMVEQLLQNRSAGEKLLIRLLYAGHTQQEIAAIVGVEERTIRRMLDRLRRSRGEGSASVLWPTRR